jgi:hypothetical protein
MIKFQILFFGYLKKMLSADCSHYLPPVLLTPATNLPPVFLTLVANLPLVSTTLAKFAASVVDTSGAP